MSMMYLPTKPEELASPCGKSADFELSRMRTVSPELAASTTTLPFTVRSLPVRRSMKMTPVARPSGPTVTSRAMASLIRSRLPEASAGGRCTVVDW